MKTGVSASPRRYSFESAGRSYGSSASSPTSTIRPSNPFLRRVAAALAPARLAPMITFVCLVMSGLPCLEPLTAAVSQKEVVRGSPHGDEVVPASVRRRKREPFDEAQPLVAGAPDDLRRERQEQFIEQADANELAEQVRAAFGQHDAGAEARREAEDLASAQLAPVADGLDRQRCTDP